MNEFEKQLKQAVDQTPPPAMNRQIWLKIQDDMQGGQKGKRRILRRRWLAAAASVLLILGIATFLFMPKEDKNQLVIDQYGLQQYEFPQKIQAKMAALKDVRLPEEEVIHFDALKNQLAFLDQQYQNYLDYIEKNGYQEYVGKQIQNYYEVKLELLEKIQLEIKKLKTNKDVITEDTKEITWQL